MRFVLGKSHGPKEPCRVPGLYFPELSSNTQRHCKNRKQRRADARGVIAGMVALVRLRVSI